MGQVILGLTIAGRIQFNKIVNDELRMLELGFLRLKIDEFQIKLTSYQIKLTSVKEEILSHSELLK